MELFSPSLSLSPLGRDLRFAIRHLRRTPIVSAVALLSLALGIGANVAIFSLVNALMLKALPIHEPDRLVSLARLGASGRQPCCFTNPQWEYLRDQQDIFAGVAAVSWSAIRFNLGTGGEARPVNGLWVSGRFFDTLGVTPALGRTLTLDDDRRGGGAAGPVAVLSHGFWLREFGGDPSTIGRTLSLDGHPFTIVGVTPRDFLGLSVGRAFDIAVPLGTEPIIRGGESSLDERSSYHLALVGRLAPGQTADQAEARLRSLQPRLREATLPQDLRPAIQAHYMSEPVVLQPAAGGISPLRDRYSQPLYVLLGIVGLVLAIACANMANLLLAQATSRRKEIAVRLSLGARRGQLIRQLLVESVLLSVTGAAAGWAIAAWGSRALVTILSTRMNAVALDLSMDWRVFGFTAAIGVATGLLFGVMPALRGTSMSPADALRDHARGVVSGGGRLNVGHALVALQVALSFVLVLGSALFVRTLVGLTTQPLGFESSRVLLATLDVGGTSARARAETSARAGADEDIDANAERRMALYVRVRDAVESTPGIEAAAASFTTPVSGNSWGRTIAVPGYEGPEQDRHILFNGITTDFFRTFGTPVLAGRDISRTDTAGAPRVALVNEAFARTFFPGVTPIGRSFALMDSDKASPDLSIEIIGLVGDAKYRTLREPPLPTMYVPMAQQRRLASAVTLAVKVATGSPPMAARDTLLQTIARVDKDIVVTLRAFTEDVDASVTQERLVASLSSFFGALALLLAALGLYGVMSYSVTRRTGEIGIRMALGAEPGRVLGLVLGHVARITLVGLLAGAAASVAAGRFVNALLFNLAATDAAMLAMTAGALAVAAATAGYLPARRAARIEPMVALREN